MDEIKEPERMRPIPIARVFAIDENRPGIARQQIIDVLSPTAMNAISADLMAAGFAKVCDISDGDTSSGEAIIFYKPSTNDYIPRQQHAEELDRMFEAFFRPDERRN